MMRNVVLMLAIALVALAGCRPTDPRSANASPGEPASAPALDPQDPTILRRPFTADQIRAAWTPGLSLTLRRTTPEDEIFERWTVVGADAEAAEIEYATVDADGHVTGEPRVERSTWNELRDHATFPAAHSTMEETVRDTDLGMLDGWLYVVRDEQAGTVTEFFFARSLPGAPVQMRVSRDGAPVLELAQIERR